MISLATARYDPIEPSRWKVLDASRGRPPLMLRAFQAPVFQTQHTLRQWTLEEAMSKGQAPERHATAEDVAKILGHLDATVMVPIMELRPTIADIEEASMWLGGDRDVFELAPPSKGVASRIVTILTANEEEEPPRAG
jgi:hypothetical protein